PAGSVSTSTLIAGPGSAPAPSPPPSPPAPSGRPAATSATLAAPAPPATPASPRPLTAASAHGSVCGRCDNDPQRREALSQRTQLARAAGGSGALASAEGRERGSWLAPAGAGVARGEPDGVLGAVEQFLAQRGGHQHARLVLEHPGVERGEDRPDPGLVQA